MLVSTLLKQEKGFNIKDLNISKSIKKSALIPVKEIYINEELNFATFVEELKVLKLDKVKVADQTDFLRNLYIITRLFGISLSDAFQEGENSMIKIDEFCTQLQSTNALEVLIQLNVYEKVLLQDVDCLKAKRNLLQKLIFTVFYPNSESQILGLKWELSPVLFYSQLFRALGFCPSSFRNLFLTRHNQIIVPTKKMDNFLKFKFKGDFHAAEQSLVQRFGFNLVVII